MDPFECAQNGSVEYFRTADKEVLLKARDKDDNTLLDTAVITDNLGCCEEICRKCPELLYHQRKGDLYTALHHAAWRGKPKMITLLINVANEFEKDDMSGIVEEKGPKMLLRMLNGSGRHALLIAVQNNQFEAAQLLMEADPEHEYSASGDGQTPLSHAMARANSGDQIAANIRKLILEMQPYQSKIRKGEKSWTPLHLSACHGDLDAIDEIIRFCKECTELVDNDNRNFLHIAAQFGQTKVVKRVLDIKDVAIHILNAQDTNEETPLHIAASSGNKEMTSAFLCDDRVSKNTVNANGQKVSIEVYKCLVSVRNQGLFHPDIERGEAFGVRQDEKELRDDANFDLVVGTLIAAVSFTAGVTVPGGFISDGPHQGMAILTNQAAFQTFVVSNTCALLLSLYSVFSYLLVNRLMRVNNVRRLLKIRARCTLGAILSMAVAFSSGSYAVLNISHGLALTVTGLCCIFFIFGFCSVLFSVSETYMLRRSIRKPPPFLPFNVD